MRVSSAALFTLATLAAGNITQQAKAAPIPTTPVENTEGVVVPVTQDEPAKVQSVAAPETISTQQFSQNQTPMQSGSGNNLGRGNREIVQGNRGQEVKKNSVVVIPSSPSSSPIPNSPFPTPSNELVVTATDIQITGATPELQELIRQTIQTKVGGETNQTQIQQDVAAILNTGFFLNARARQSTTPTGLSIVYEVQPVIVRSLELEGAKVLTYQEALKSFQPMVGKPISPSQLRAAVQQINKWYKDNNYSLARVLSIAPTRQGILSLNVAEGLVSQIKFRFLNDDGEAVDSKGKPVTGRTKPDFLQRQLTLKPGQVFKDDIVRQDLQKLYSTGLFQGVNIALEGDATKTDIIYELKEIGARSINFGGNYSGDQGILGTFSYRDQNFGGVNDTLGLDVQVSTRDIGFNTIFKSPYRGTDPKGFGYSINAFRRRGLSETFDDEIKLANGDKVREGKYGASLSFQRPIDGWDTTLGFNYSRTSLRDSNNNINSVDANGNPLSFSGKGVDDLATVSLTAIKDRRNNIFNPTKGSILSLSTEQSIPVGMGDISMTRFKANYSQFIPVNLLNSKQPEVFAFNVQGGTVLGDLPPYETFNLGGSSSVRGYNGSQVGSARSFVQASAEYRFPILQSLGGVAFADFASDLGSGDTVVGNPAGVRNKPGSGFGYGLGVRFNSPLGLLRADYGISDQGESRVHFGFGQNF